MLVLISSNLVKVLIQVRLQSTVLPQSSRQTLRLQMSLNPSENIKLHLDCWPLRRWITSLMFYMKHIVWLEVKQNQRWYCQVGCPLLPYVCYQDHFDIHQIPFVAQSANLVNQ